MALAPPAGYFWNSTPVTFPAQGSPRWDPEPDTKRRNSNSVLPCCLLAAAGLREPRVCYTQVTWEDGLRQPFCANILVRASPTPPLTPGKASFPVLSDLRGKKEDSQTTTFASLQLPTTPSWTSSDLIGNTIFSWRQSLLTDVHCTAAGIGRGPPTR